jgi:ATP-dependent Lhr-like helicase
VYGGRTVGTLPALYVPQVGEHFLLAGRRWQVIEIDDDSREILVRPAHGRKAPRFLGAGGEIHHRVRQKMRDVLLGAKAYPYLNQTGSDLLAHARRTAERVGLSMNPLIALGENRCLWFTWTGTKTQRTLCLFADAVGLAATDRDIAIEFESGVRDVFDKLSRAYGSAVDARALAKRIPVKQVRKFDEYVSEELLTFALASDAIDASAARRIIGTLLKID